ncbi:acetate--CoA ligase family protein [Hyphomonas chukchiensis]|uniref:acetate--CoA ligase family protein n=1 Tax=Hyphomonas chukchiensis TaxID=1280947 RepID=UPI0009DD4D70|nr:acetate--CoA ligase family protein [Hyphomonas chukchiensis]
MSSSEMRGAASSLTPLFEPESVAIIGASNDPNRIGGRPLHYLLRSGYVGKIYPINPNRKVVQEIPAYPCISGVPGSVDLVMIVLPASEVIDELEKCAKLGVKVAVILSSGFAELGEEGAVQQSRLSEIGRAYGIRILGPNCLGVFNSSIGFFATFTAAFHHQSAVPGPLAIVSQSGACGGHLAYLCGQRGIGIHYWVTTGNEADIDVSESLLWLAQSPKVKVILVYAEAIRNGDLFVEALETARRNGKSVIMLKVGRSVAGARAAASHTGALAGEDAVYDAVLRQFGVWRAESVEEMLDVAYACLGNRFPASRRIGLVSASGGIGVQMADKAERLGMDVAVMPEAVQKKMKALIPFIAPANPVDVTAQVINDMSLFQQCLDLTLDRGNYDSVIVFLSSGPASAAMRDQLLSIFKPLRIRYPEQVIVLSMAAPRDTVEAFEKLGLIVFEDTDRALNAMAALAYFAESFGDTVSKEIDNASLPEKCEFPSVLNEHVAKSILANAGIHPWPEVLALDSDEVGRAAEHFARPVALKIVSPDIQHKTEVQGVALGLTSPADAAARASEMLNHVRKVRPDAKIEGFLVSPMRGDALEISCGSFRDPVFGPVVMFGLGGIFVEVLKDVAFRRAPFDEAEAHRLIDSIRGRSMLDGVRGGAAVNLQSVARTLAALSKFAYVNREQVSEIDINPLSAASDGAYALDALIVRG